MGRYGRQKQPKKEKQAKNWQRSGVIIKHHILNRCRGGSNKEHNLLSFDSEREKAWHFLFQNLSFKEAAELLLRCDRAKRASA